MTLFNLTKKNVKSQCIIRYEVGVGYSTHGVMMSHPTIFKLQRHFMSSGPRKPPKITYSKNRYTNSRNLMTKKKSSKRNHDSENSPMKNVVKTTPRVSSVNPYNDSTTKRDINKPSGTETNAYLSVINTKDTPVVFTDKRSFLANVEGEPTDSLNSVFAKVLLIPTNPESVSSTHDNNTIPSPNNKTLDSDLKEQNNNRIKNPHFFALSESKVTSTEIGGDNSNRFYLKEIYDEEIKKYNELKQIQSWTLEKTTYLKNITRILSDFYNENYDKYEIKSRDFEELMKIKNLYNNIKEEWLQELIINLSREVIKDRRLKIHYEKEILRCTEMMSYLRTYGTIVPDPVFHEITRRLDIIINNDAIYKDVYGNSITIKEGEGSTLKKEIYTYMSQNKKVYFKENLIELKEQELNEVFAKITSGDFFVVNFKQDNNLSLEDKFIESGDERHMHLMIKIKKNMLENICLSVGFFTSTKDQNTIKLTDKQYTNEDNIPVNKAQRFRPFNQFLHIRTTDFIEITQATNYARNNNCENVNIQEKLIAEVLIKEKALRANPIREVLQLTKENLQKVALENGAIYLENLKKELELKNKILEQKQNTKEKQCKNLIKAQQESAFFRHTPLEIRELYKIKTLLEIEKKKNK